MLARPSFVETMIELAQPERNIVWLTYWSLVLLKLHPLGCPETSMRAVSLIKKKNPRKNRQSENTARGKSSCQAFSCTQCQAQKCHLCITELGENMKECLTFLAKKQISVFVVIKLRWSWQRLFLLYFSVLQLDREITHVFQNWHLQSSGYLMNTLHIASSNQKVCVTYNFLGMFQGVLQDIFTLRAIFNHHTDAIHVQEKTQEFHYSCVLYKKRVSNMLHSLADSNRGS